MLREKKRDRLKNGRQLLSGLLCRVKQLRNQHKALLWSIDRIARQEESIQVFGWAFSRATEEVSLALEEKTGEPVAFIRHETSRPDVELAILGREAGKKLGFCLEFERKAGQSRYILRLQDGKKTAAVEVDTEKAGQGSGAGWSCHMDYEAWREKHRVSEEEWREQRQSRFPTQPLISILVPTYNTPPDYLNDMVHSVQAQSYENWELCLADGSEGDAVYVALQETLRKDPRLRYKRLEENRGISENTNAALHMAKGEWIGLLDHDDVLEPDALFWLVRTSCENEAVEAIYTDEDKTSRDRREYYEPHFKSDFNPQLLRSNNYICHFFAVKRELAEKVGGFRSQYDGSQDYDFILRCTEVARQVQHIPRVLYHWRAHPASTAARQESKLYCYEAGRMAIVAQLERRRIRATVKESRYHGFYQVSYEVQGEPLVSVILPGRIPEKERKQRVQRLLAASDYRKLEFLFAEEKEAVSAAEKARGEYLLFLNIDAQPTSPDWVSRLLGDCQQEEIGIVGVKVTASDGSLQHVGLLLGINETVAWPYAGCYGEECGYFGRAFVKQNLSVVSEACFMISRQDLLRAGAQAGNGSGICQMVELCLCMEKLGKQVLLDPDVVLCLQKGQELWRKRELPAESEWEQLKERWGEARLTLDPYYSPNFPKRGRAYQGP